MEVLVLRVLKEKPAPLAKQALLVTLVLQEAKATLVKLEPLGQ